MKLLLISASTRKINDIIDTLNENVTYLIIDKFETLATFTDKLTTLNLDYESIDDVALVFDNTGNKCPLFEFTTDEINEYETLKSQQIIPDVIIDETEYTNIVYANRVDIKSEFIQSNDFFSDSLISVIDYIKTLCDIEDVTIVTKDYLLSRDVKLNTKNVDNTYVNITNLLLGVRAVPVDGNIYTPDDLYALMQSTNTADMSRSYTLMNDIDMSGYESESIGKSELLQFLGSFDGNSFTITINQTLVDGYSGFFKFIGNNSAIGVIVKNLTIKYINTGFGLTTVPVADSFIEMGGLAADLYKATIQNCNLIYTQDTIVSFLNPVSINKNLYIGSFVGYSSNSIIENCSLISEKELSINNTYLNTVAAARLIVIGGFIGRSDNSIINNCSNLFKQQLFVNNSIFAVGSDLYSNGFIGSFNTSIIENFDYTCLEIVSLNITNLSQTNPATNILSGLIGRLENGKILNFTANISNLEIIIENNRYNVLAGAFIGFLNSGILDNVALNYTEIDINYKKNSSNSAVSSNSIIHLGGLFGINNGNINNCNLICENLNVTFTQDGKSYMNNLRMGGISAFSSNTTLLNSTLVVNKVYTTNLNINANNTDNKIFYLGGLIGLFSNISNLNNCNAFINKYKQNISFIADNPSLITYYYGGLIGSLFSVPNYIRNSSIFFGEESNVVANMIPVSYIGGVFGFIQNTNYLTENCIVVYNNYKLYANTINSAITAINNSGISNNSLSISYGAPLDNEGVQNMDGPSATNDVIAIFNSNQNTQWLTGLLNFRQNLNPIYSSSEYLASILSSTTDTSLKSRNAAVQNSMYFRNLQEINTTFGVIKSSLQDYSLNIPDSKSVKYIITQDIYIPLLDEINPGYILDNNGIYYLFNSFSGIKQNDTVLLYESYITPPGVTFTNRDNQSNFTLLDESYTLPNKKSIKVLGVGSALLEVTEEKIPSKKTNNWWWIVILIVLAVILCIFLFLYFYCGYKPFEGKSIQNLS